jgi:hypothetical protein
LYFLPPDPWFIDSIDTGEATPIKRNPYRTPYALKSVVDEHIDDMLQREIIEPSSSPWSSSIVLVQKKSKDISVKYRKNTKPRCGH